MIFFWKFLRFLVFSVCIYPFFLILFREKTFSRFFSCLLVSVLISLKFYSRRTTVCFITHRTKGHHRCRNTKSILCVIRLILFQATSPCLHLLSCAWAHSREWSTASSGSRLPSMSSRDGARGETGGASSRWSVWSLCGCYLISLTSPSESPLQPVISRCKEMFLFSFYFTHPGPAAGSTSVGTGCVLGLLPPAALLLRFIFSLSHVIRYFLT